MRGVSIGDDEAQQMAARVTHAAIGTDANWPVGALVLGAAIATAALAAFLPTAAETVHIWSTSSTYQHGFIIAPIALWLIARRGLAEAPRTAPIFLAPLAGSCLLWLTGRAAGANIIEQVAFVGALVSLIGLTFGLKNARRWSFALGFLIFLVPFGESLLPPLQAMTALGASALLSVVGVPAQLDGDMITTPAGRFAIAEACAGLNLLLAASVIAALLAHLSFRTLKAQCAFFAFATAAALAANLLRAFLVILAATLSDGRIAIGADHLAFGLVFYGTLVCGLVYCGWRFGRFEAAPRRDWSIPAFTLSRSHLAAAFMLAATGGYAALVISDAASGEATAAPSPPYAADWRKVDASSLWRAQLDDAALRTTQALRSGDREVTLDAGSYGGADAARRSTRARSFDGDEWRRIDMLQEKIVVDGAVRTINIDRLEGKTGAKFYAVTLYEIGDALVGDRRQVKVFLAARRLFGKSAPVTVYVIAAADAATIRALLEHARFKAGA